MPRTASILSSFLRLAPELASFPPNPFTLPHGDPLTFPHTWLHECSYTSSYTWMHSKNVRRTNPSKDFLLLQVSNQQYILLHPSPCHAKHLNIYMTHHATLPGHIRDMLEMLLALMVRLINPPLAPANVPLHTDVVYCATLTLFLLVCFVLPSSKNKCLWFSIISK